MLHPQRTSDLARGLKPPGSSTQWRAATLRAKSCRVFLCRVSCGIGVAVMV